MEQPVDQEECIGRLVGKHGRAELGLVDHGQSVDREEIGAMPKGREGPRRRRSISTEERWVTSTEVGYRSSRCSSAEMESTARWHGVPTGAAFSRRVAPGSPSWP